MTKKKQTSTKLPALINVIGAIHVVLDKHGKPHLNTNKMYYWQVSRTTENKYNIPTVDHFFPPVGHIMVVKTASGPKIVAVVTHQVVQGGQAVLQAAANMYSTLRYTNKSVRDLHLTRAFNNYLESQGLPKLPNRTKK